MFLYYWTRTTTTWAELFSQLFQTLLLANYFYNHLSILVGFYWLYPPVLLQIAVLISVGFIGCWMPYGMVNLWSIFRDSSTIPPEVSLLPCMFAKSSTVYNPLIYYIFSQSFRREVKQLRWLCLGSNPCHVSNSINDTSIYMVSVDMKPKVARPTLQEITESKTVSLGWKTFLGYAWEERLYSSTETFVLLTVENQWSHNVLSHKRQDRKPLFLFIFFFKYNCCVLP